VLLLALATFARADELDRRGPVEIIEAATGQVLTAIEQARGYYDEAPERFYDEVERILAPVVDFQGFARGVMGYHGSVDAYRQLKSEAEREAFKARISRFDPKLRETMVAGYSKGLLAVKIASIEVVPPDDATQARIAAGDTVQIVQRVSTGEGEPFLLKYLLKPNREGEWKVRNLDVDGVDLGRVYRSQFAASVRDLGGDVDRAIDSWSFTDAGSDNTSSS